MAHSSVLVLMATYNGELYVRQMIDSVFEQDYPNIHLVLSDDGSKDGTVAILEEYAGKYPEMVTHYRSGMRFGCAQKHFMHLLSVFCDAPYIMFCDQDDVWHTDKVSKTMKKMREIEVDGVPALVHTDLRVVDANLKEVSPSFCRHSNLDGSRLALNELLVQNVVTGCTVMINKQLAELACTEVNCDAMLMHDWWLAILASSCGITGFLSEATIDYRQHGNNSVGAKNVRSAGYVIGRLKSNVIINSMKASFNQAKAFENCFSSVIPDEKRKLIIEYAGLGEKNGIARRAAYIRNGFWKKGFFRCIGQLFLG